MTKNFELIRYKSILDYDLIFVYCKKHTNLVILSVSGFRNKYKFLLLTLFLVVIAIVKGICISPGYVFDKSKVIIDGSLRPFSIKVDVSEHGKESYLVHIHLHAPSPAPPPHFSAKVKFPRDKVNQLWNSQTWSNKSHFTLPSYDRSAASFSIISGLTLNDRNQVTFTCDDRFNARFVSTSVQEEGDSLNFTLDFFEDNPPLTDMQEYEVDLLLDFRNVHFSEAIYQASRWKLADKFEKGVVSADTTKVPVFSTWYPMHRNIPLENLTREVDSLQTFHFKSILVDDGWQALVKMKVDTVFDYEEQSFKTLSSFTEKVGKMGLKYYMWYSLPFTGGNPMIAKKFEGKYVRYKAPRQLYVLDPRYPEIRQHLVSTYARFFGDWQFDGFWFDFLKDFYPLEGVTMEEDLGRDYVDLGLAVDELRKQMSDRLTAVKPTVFMGQDFDAVGPNQNSYQNFLTGFVGVNSTKLVREKMVNNRLLYGEYTPFMEIMAVHARDKCAEVARKFQSVMFGNPYLSFFVTTMPDDTKKTIRFWLNFWQENYDLLMRSDFEPMKVAQQYPVIKVENENHLLYAVYEDYTLSLPLTIDKQIDIVNSKESQQINLVISQPGIVYHYQVLDHKGDVVTDDQIKTKKTNTLEFLVPEGGILRFFKQ